MTFEFAQVREDVTVEVAAQLVQAEALFQFSAMRDREFAPAFLKRRRQPVARCDERIREAPAQSDPPIDRRRRFDTVVTAPKEHEHLRDTQRSPVIDLRHVGEETPRRQRPRIIRAVGGAAQQQPVVREAAPALRGEAGGGRRLAHAAFGEEHDAVARGGAVQENAVHHRRVADVEAPRQREVEDPAEDAQTVDRVQDPVVRNQYAQPAALPQKLQPAGEGAVPGPGAPRFGTDWYGFDYLHRRHRRRRSRIDGQTQKLRQLVQQKNGAPAGRGQRFRRTGQDVKTQELHIFTPRSSSRG